MQRKKILCFFISLLAMAFVFSTMPVMAKSTGDSSTKSSSKSSKKSSTSKSNKTKKKSKSKSKTKKNSKTKKSSKSKKGTTDKSSSAKKKTKSSKKKSHKTSKATKKKTGKVNINTADAKTLTEFTGIGPVTAKKIVAYRKKNGKFKSAKDLMNVKGIGEKTLMKMRPQLKF